MKGSDDITGKGEIQIEPIGQIKNDFTEEVPEDYKDKESVIEIFEGYKEGLLGIGEHSHITVLMWFHKGDRSIKQVHPMADEDNPLTGVFATRSPVRPNPVAVSVCRLVERKGDELLVKGLDALDGTPVIDIKSYSPYDISDPEYPDWIPR
ncbi:MAG: tRNA (N6-threonylcarbamoyladenosine(37)-N6)-methyltransferase TrmO [Candidatus Thermoplasmatota archaeon]|nr:tRNA (N6-threonylcarbamoyladenosine(37)-N6)-methyltransferase TrmO [Candidatus Thermoplasmatota archaeon]